MRIKMLITERLASVNRYLRIGLLRLSRAAIKCFGSKGAMSARQTGNLQDNRDPDVLKDRRSISIEALIDQDSAAPSSASTAKGSEFVNDELKHAAAEQRDTPFQNNPDYPRHVAIIMDGNNRWARQRAGIAVSGHRAGVETIRGVLRGCEQYGVEVLTLFAFSSENWARPDAEVNELMRLFRDYLDREVRELHQKNIRLRFIGRRDRLEQDLVERMRWAEQLTSGNNGKTLVLAVDYGGRWDIAQACQQLCNELLGNQSTALSQSGERVQQATLSEMIDETALSRHVSLADLPEPDLCIRTGGEVRVSNFMLWQFSYAEFYFTNCYWPDFTEQEFAHALEAYAGRQRRFGRTSSPASAKKVESKLHA